MQLVNPQYLYPIGGSYRHMRQYQRLALQIGFQSQQIILPQSAQIVDLTSTGKARLAETLDLREIRLQQSVK